MTDGYDHDFEVPPGAFRVAFAKIAQRWPEGIAELSGNVLIPLAVLGERAPDTLDDGFVAYRDAAARERFHRYGGFVDADGESPLNVFLRYEDEMHLHLDLVFEFDESPLFSLAVHEAVGRGVAKALRTTPSPEWAPMDRAWYGRTLDALRPPHVPRDSVRRESAFFIALACWHRIRFEQTPHLIYTQPPGRLTMVDCRLAFKPDLAGPSPKV